MKPPKISNSEATDKFLTTLHSWTDSLVKIGAEKNQSRTIEMASQAFAAKMMHNEMQALGLSVREAAATEEQSRLCLIRLYDWLLARVDAYSLLIGKEIPEGEHPDKEFAEAAFLAATFWEKDRRAELEKLSKNARQKFEHELARPTRAGWKCPPLDMWLLSIWPLATAYDWTYRDVWIIAQAHPELEDFEILNRSASFAKHCKNLDLRLTEKASNDTGRVTKDMESKLPYMADVALKCGAILPADSCFS